MSRTEAEIAEDNKTLDSVIASGDKNAISWLRVAFHSHASALASLRQTNAELRAMYLFLACRPLTVKEAQMCDVCRICRNAPKASPGMPFKLDYGDEFAHQACLDASFQPEVVRG